MYTVNEIREMALWGEGPFERQEQPKKQSRQKVWRGEWQFELFPFNDEITLELCVGYRPLDKMEPDKYDYSDLEPAEEVSFYADNRKYLTVQYYQPKPIATVWTS